MSIACWGISCSLEQFWPGRCSWKRKLLPGSDAYVLQSCYLHRECTGRAMTKESLYSQFKALLLASTETKSFPLCCHKATFFMHIPAIFGIFFHRRHKITREILLGTQKHKIVPSQCFSFICLCFLWWCIHKVGAQTTAVSDTWLHKEA